MPLLQHQRSQQQDDRSRQPEYNLGDPTEDIEWDEEENDLPALIAELEMIEKILNRAVQENKLFHFLVLG